MHLWNFQPSIVPLWRHRQLVETLLRGGIRSPKALRVKEVAETLYEYRQNGGNAIGVGIHRWHHQWYGIWRNPQPPRLRELAIVSAIALRTRGLPNASVFDDKLGWLRKCLVEGSRFARLVAIASSMWMGAYRRFGVPYAFARDVMAALRSSR